MTPFVAIRHAPTGWNAEGRIQGQRDAPLSAEGRAAAEAWRLPPEFAGPEWVWLVSPLSRARETARLLWPGPGAPAVRLEPALMEMRWGQWEGRMLADLRHEGGATMAENEARGLDFRPPGGESPRDLQTRLKPLLARVAAEGRPALAVCHRGVIRALVSLATGWDMTGKPPVEPAPGCAHAFRLAEDGRPEIDRFNIPLEVAAADQGSAP